MKVPTVNLITNEHQRDYVIREDQVQQFALEPGLIGKLVPFLIDTGLRRSECCALAWERVSFSTRSIHITKGKTKFARRRIPLTTRAEGILNDLPRDGKNVFTLRRDYGRVALACIPERTSPARAAE